MRPPAPTASDGYRYEAVEEDPKTWRAIEPELARPCRQRTKDREGARGTCRVSSVVAMNRTPGGQNWWHYCAGHTFGRWVEDTDQGLKVFHWRLVDDVDLPV